MTESTNEPASAPTGSVELGYGKARVKMKNVSERVQLVFLIVAPVTILGAMSINAWAPQRDRRRSSSEEN
ncbi:hypothetical protein [Streptomyces sp. NPDC004042]|uniref:hypothetical protein n=1 Tax=Streptomyces sp. NPDC004042 TaxID=3154451 RepID=UPI0033A62BA9